MVMPTRAVSPFSRPAKYVLVRRDGTVAANCVAVLDYDKYSSRFGKEAAKKVVRFELAHHEAIASVVKSFGADLFDRSEIRHVHTVAAIFSDQKLRDMKPQLKAFEDAFPDLKGRWWICEGEELSTV